MNPKITLSPRVAVTLEAIRNAVGDIEYSGFGFCTQNEEGIYIYDFVLLDVGKWAYTEISTKDIVPLMNRKDAPNMKVWVHRHPMGNGKPGEHNWSSTDEHTIQTRPLGGIPELVKWSASIVFTPCGWVGRIDNHLARQTIHVPVYPRIRWSQVLKAEGMYAQYINSLLIKNDESDSDALWVDDDIFTMDPEEVEKYFDEFADDDAELDEDDDELGMSQQDYLLSHMHVTALHSARALARR